MLTSSQRARITHHLERKWKVPDSLARELWEAYQELEAMNLARHAVPAPTGYKGTAKEERARGHLS